eukprot:TRINITY_DN897_c0_g1_i3.p1 TRINITY_DN897_c0_g1~~TRINITY_DN897_c0_g1_i3.p1  ORF type:complete len:114 (+),score=24.52 TRINITY_DN897_c0_g1_i3:105-446(+)
MQFTAVDSLLYPEVVEANMAENVVTPVEARLTRAQKHTRRYFDSANWMLTGEIGSPHPELFKAQDIEDCPTPPPHDPDSNAANVVKDRLKEKGRKRGYFDSADWVLYLSLIHI